MPCLEQEIDNARRTLAQARKDTQTAFQKYASLLEAERRAQNALSVADERRNELGEFDLLYGIGLI